MQGDRIDSVNKKLLYNQEGDHTNEEGEGIKVGKWRGMVKMLRCSRANIENYDSGQTLPA